MEVKAPAHANTAFSIIALSITSFAFLLSPSAVATQPSQCDSVRYVSIDLGVLSQEFPFSSAQNLNDRGQVIGTSSVSESTGRGFIWDCERGMENIGALAPDDFVSFPLDINDRGEIVGLDNDLQGSERAFIWDPKRGMRAITGLASAYGISNAGQVLGGSEGVIHLWTAQNGAIPLESVIGVGPIQGAQIDASGRIGGVIGDIGSTQFFTWTSRHGVRLLGATPSDASRTDVEAVNARGDLSGILNFFDSGVITPYLLRANGELELLAANAPRSAASAHSINDRRQIVGRMLEDDESFYLWDPTNGLRDLNEVLYGSPDGDGEARITQVAAINDAGWIAASVQSATSGTVRAHLFVAVPGGNHKYDAISHWKGPRLCRALDKLRDQSRRCDEAALR